MTLISADPVATTMTLDWTIIGESQSDCSSANLAACSDVNIFFDKSDFILFPSGYLTDPFSYSNLLSSPAPILRTSDRPKVPIFQFNATTFALRDVVANTPTFRTDLSLFSLGAPYTSILYYPFDK